MSFSSPNPDAALKTAPREGTGKHLGKPLGLQKTGKQTRSSKNNLKCSIGISSKEEKGEEEDTYPNILEQVEEGNSIYQATWIQLRPRKRPHLPSRGWESTQSGQKQADGKLQYSTINAPPRVTEQTPGAHGKGPWVWNRKTSRRKRCVTITTKLTLTEKLLCAGKHSKCTCGLLPVTLRNTARQPLLLSPFLGETKRLRNLPKATHNTSK